MNNELSKENTIVAYVDQLNKKPCLLEIYNQKIDTVQVYDEMNSTDSEVLESIIGEVIDKYPSPSKYKSISELIAPAPL